MSRVRLDDQQFSELTKLLHELAGLSFDTSRRESLGFSIAERMQATSCPDVSSYLRLLQSADAGEERQSLLDEVTIPETHFFRNPPQVRALRRHVLPELLRQASGSRRLRIWSAGCSTGEEPYTVAMLVRELVPAGAGWDVRIVATDVSTRALATARAGSYGERAFVMTEAVDLRRWFVLDTTSGGFTVRDEVRELVEFRHHNLVTDEPPFAPGEIDLILCRNVTIYFDRDTTRTLMKRLHGRLREGGYLFLGHSETLWQVSDDFALVPIGDAFVYRRPAGGEVPERRAVLPDRRTEDEPLPLRAERRQPDLDRREVRRAAESSQQRPQDRLVSARDAVADGRYAEAADLAAEAAAENPLRAEAHYVQGQALATLGRDEDAATALRRAVYLDPELGFAHFLLAGSLARLGESAAAAGSYRAAAAALRRRPVLRVAQELGGRTAAELAALCDRLAQRIDGQPPGDGG